MHRSQTVYSDSYSARRVRITQCQINIVASMQVMLVLVLTVYLRMLRLVLTVYPRKCHDHLAGLQILLLPRRHLYVPQMFHLPEQHALSVDYYTLARHFPTQGVCKMAAQEHMHA
jgi:hypothetical protein